MTRVTRPLSTREQVTALAGPLGVAFYVGTWFVLGQRRANYDPMQEAISRLFEVGAPYLHRLALSLALATTGLALVAFAWLLDRRIPGEGRLGPVLLLVSGVATTAVVAFPCTAGCPGVGTSFTDTMHVIVAATGYAALVTAPIATGMRIRAHWPGVARWSLALGAVALVGFLVRNAGVDAYGGLQQRVFNTVADGWVAMMGVVILQGHVAAQAVVSNSSTRPSA